MKGQVNDGGPAYPSKEVIPADPTGTVGDTIIHHQGLSLRAYAAIAALPQAIQEGWMTPKETAQSAISYADALLEALDA